MPYYINLPDGRDVEFPDNYPRAEAMQIARSMIVPTAAQEVAPAPEQPERGLFGTIAARAGDVGGSVVSGAGGVLGGIGGLAGMAGAGFDNAFIRGGRSLQETGESLMSDELRAKRTALTEAMKAAEGQGFIAEASAAFKAIMSDPGLLASMAIEQIPQFVLSGGVGRGAMAVGQIAGRTGARAAVVGAERAGAQAAVRADAAAAMTTGAGLQGGEVANQAYRDVMNLPTETLAQSPAFQDLIRNMSPTQARQSLAETIAREAGVIGAGVSAATMYALPGAEKLMFAKEVSKNAMRRVLGGVVGEATQEAIEEGGGQFAQNLAARQADVDRDLTRGVAGAATQGAILGGIVGGGIAGIRGGPRQEQADAERLPTGLRQAINEYVSNREPVEGERLLTREEQTIETPVGNLSRSQLERYMEKRLPDMMEADPALASRFQYAETLGDDNAIRQEKEAIFQDALVQSVEQDRQDREMASSQRALERVEAMGLKLRTEEAVKDKIKSFDRQVSILNDSLESAKDFLFKVQANPNANPGTIKGAQTKVDNINANLQNKMQVIDDLIFSVPAMQAKYASPESKAEDARSAFAIARARAERLEAQKEAPGLEVPSGTLAPDTIPAQREDLRAGAPEITEQRYILNPVYENGEIVGGENVVKIDNVDNFGNVLAYVNRPRGDTIETVPVETTMDKLVPQPVRETPRMTQEVSSNLVEPRRGVDVEGQSFDPRAAIDRVGRPELSARQAEAPPVVAPVATPTAQEVRAEKRKVSQDKINKLYLDKLKAQGRSGRLLRNGLIDALKNRTLNADQVYAAFIAAETIAPLLPAKADHRIQFVARLLSDDDASLAASGGTKGEEAQGLRIRPAQPGLLGLIQISLSPKQTGFLRETAAHEAFHVLQDYYRKYDPKFAQFIDGAFKDRMMITDVNASIRRKLQSFRAPNSNRSYWDTLVASLPKTLDAREAQAYAFGALVDAKNRGVPMTGLTPSLARFINSIATFFNKFGNALRGNGYQTVEDVFGAVAAGDARRFDERESPTAIDFPKPSQPTKNEAGPSQSTLVENLEKAKRNEDEAIKRYDAATTDEERSAAEAENIKAKIAREDAQKAFDGAAGGRGQELKPLTESVIQLSARKANMSVPEFKTWWEGGWRGKGYTPKQSVARLNGLPIEFYHGTQKNYRRFGKARSGSYGQEGPFFFSPDTGFSNDYAMQALYAGAKGTQVTSGQRIIPVYLSIQNPFDSTNPKRQDELLKYVNDGLDDGSLTWRDIAITKDILEIKQSEFERSPSLERKVARGAYTVFQDILTGNSGQVSEGDNWQALETPAAQKFLREKGFDSFYLVENGIKNVAVFDPRQIKSVFNKFEEGAATAPEFSARQSSLMTDPSYQQYMDGLTGTGIPRSGIFGGLFRRLVGAMESTSLYGTPNTPERLRDALVRTSVNRTHPVWMLQMLAQKQGVLNGRDIGLAVENALTNTGRMQLLTEISGLGFDPATGDITMRDDVPSLMQVFKDKVDSKNQRAFQTYAIALRERDLRAAGKSGMKNMNGRPFTSADIDNIINTAERANPDFIQVAADLKKFSDHLLDFAVDSGIMTRSKAQELALLFYTPFYREMEDDAKNNPGQIIGPSISSTLRNTSNALDKKLGGGDGKIGDLFENVIRNADSIIRAGLKNYAIRMTAEVARDVNLGKVVKQTGPGVVTYRVNGNEVHFQVEDSLLFTAMATAPAKTRWAIVTAMAKMAGFFRDMVTLAPSFMWANLYRGKFQAYAQEGASFSPFTTIKGLQDSLKGGASYRAFTAQTGFGGYAYGMGEKDFSKKFKKILDDRGLYGELARGNVLAPFTKAINGLQKVSEATELAERLAIYEKMKRDGMTDKQAAFQAYLLAPFSRQGSGDGFFGSIVSGLIPLVPFLNAKVQSLYRLVENEKGAKTIAKIPQQIFLRSLMVTAFSSALYAMALAGGHEDELDKLTVDDIIRYDSLFLGNKQLIALPRNFEIGSFFGAIPILVMEAYRKGHSDDLTKAVASIGTSTLFFNPIPQAVLPIVSVVTNYDFFRSRPIESGATQRLLPEERVDRNTTTIAKLLSQLSITASRATKTGTTEVLPAISPIDMQFLLNGYTGSIGAGMMAGLDTILGGLGLIPGKPAGAFGDPTSPVAMAAALSGLSRFYRTEETSSSRFIGEFYKIKELSEQVNNSMREATLVRDFDKIMDLRGERGPLISMKSMINSTNTRMSDLNKRIRTIEAGDLSPTEKLEMIAPLRERRDTLARSIVDRARSLGAI